MASPLHIAFFNRSFYPDTTATGQLLTELCEELVRDYGCRVSVVAGLPLLPSAQNGNPQNVDSGTTSSLLLNRESYRQVSIFRAKGTRFSKDRFVGRFSNYVSYFLTACYAGQKLDRPDVVVSLTDPPIIGLAGYLTARRFRSPFVMAYKDIFPEVARLLEDFDSPLVEKVLQSVNCFLASRADRVAALGSTMRRRLVEGKGADPARTVIIPDWTDCEKIRPAAKINPFSRVHGLTDKFVVMHSGNIGLSQGLETLVEAARGLADYPDIQVVFVGEGVKKASLQKRVNELGLQNVSFLPFQPKELLIESFAAADLFVVSLKQGLAGYIVPSKLYGILASGRPYVAAVEEESEVAEITLQNECGLLAKLGDPQDLSQKIIQLYQDRDRTSRMGENARRAGERFDRPIQVRAYHDLFRDLHTEFSGGVRPTPLLKRVLDVTLSALGLLVSSPVWLLAAVAIKVQDGGPVFYGQHRIGRGGRRFKSWKFRSMVPGADKRYGLRQAEKDDPRVTRVGRLLRATAMDELPQLWNIFSGDMSFVGPRALLPEEIEVDSADQMIPMKEIPGYFERHSVTPGLTGIAQIFAPRDVPRKKKFRLDNFYIRNRSFWLDLRLIGLSFWITLRGKWEHRGQKL